MRIKMSKSQWEEIGKQGGWIKTADVSKNIVPVEQILGTSPSGSIDQIDQDMHSKGYYLFREHYKWGKTLSYRNDAGDKVYLVDGRWTDWNRLIENVKETWRPASREEQDWFVANLGGQ